MDDLHFAIQRAIRWDANHLYSFFMGGMEHNGRYRFSCPYEEDHPHPVQKPQACLSDCYLWFTRQTCACLLNCLSGSQAGKPASTLRKDLRTPMYCPRCLSPSQ